MTRANSRSPLYAFYPEIERIRCKLRRGIRTMMANGQNDGQIPIDGQDLSAPTIGQNPLAPDSRTTQPTNSETINNNKSKLFDII
ncbi:hypothetical protein GQ457_09G015930 [Hibiscus cannabinus]